MPFTQRRANLKPTKHALVCGVGKTKQSFAKEVNVNTIVQRYKKTGQLMRGPVRQKMYFGDFSKITGLQESIELVNSARKSFMSLPAKVRARFRNSPVELLSFLKDPNNKAEAIELGLLPKPPKARDPERPPKEEITPPPPTE